MTYVDAKKIKPGDVVLRKNENYKPTRVFEVITDTANRHVFFRCSDGTYQHTTVMKAVSLNEMMALYLHQKSTRVFINHNNDTGEWLYSIEVDNSDGFWLASFDTQPEAERYIKENNLKLKTA